MAKSVVKPGQNLPVTSTPAPNFLSSFGSIGAGIEGDFGAESSRIPFLSIGQKTSDIVEQNPLALGAIIYAGKHLVPKPAALSFYGARQYYRQNLPFDRNAINRGSAFATKQEVLNAGGNLERFVKAGADDHNFVPELMAKVVLFSVKGDNGEQDWAQADDIMSFPAENGLLVVPLLWTIRGVAYGQCVPPLRMVDRALRENGREIAFARFRMNVVKQTFSSNSTFVPVLDREAEDNSVETVKVLHQIFDL